jgi:hypothetical protein
VVINKSYGVVWPTFYDCALVNAPKVEVATFLAGTMEVIVKRNVKEWCLRFISDGTAIYREIVIARTKPSKERI